MYNFQNESLLLVDPFTVAPAELEFARVGIPLSVDFLASDVEVTVSTAYKRISTTDIDSSTRERTEC